MSRWRIGIIGCGWAGSRHARAVQAFRDRAVLTAVADSNAEVAQSQAKKWEVSTWTSDYRDLLTTTKLDAVSLCLPHSLHSEVAVAAAEAGLHLLVEKPLAPTLS